MSLQDETHFHDFLKNKEMNEMYISTFLIAFAKGLISIFVPIYLYFLGYSISEILFYFFILSSSFVVLSPFLIRLIPKLGVKHSMSVSIPLLVIYFLGLSLLEDLPSLFYILPILAGARLVLYNVSYHLNYLEHSDAKKKGKELSVLVSIPVLASLLSPFFGGLIISNLGYAFLYAIGSIILVSATIPLLLTKDQKEPIAFHLTDVLKDVFAWKNRFLSLSFVGYAVATTIALTVWPIFLTTLNLSASNIGFIVSAAAIVTLVVFYFVGEKGDEKKAIKTRSFWHTLGWIGRIFTDSAFGAFLVDSYKKLTFRILYVPWSAYSYDLAKKQDYFKFVVAREITFNLSRVIFIPLIIYIFEKDFYPFTVSFIFAAILSSLYPLITKHAEEGS